MLLHFFIRIKFFFAKKALSQKDMRIIKKKKKHFFEILITENYSGYCYSTCYFICTLLKKGSIVIISHPMDDEYYSNNIHVLFINNKYVFDTNFKHNTNIKRFRKKSIVQYPDFLISKLYENYYVYKDFSYEEIKKFTDYEDFRENIRIDLKSWAKQHNAYCEI